LFNPFGESPLLPRRLRPFFYPFRRYYYPLLGKSIELPEAEASARLLYPRLIDQNDKVVEVGARTGGGSLLLSELANHVYSFEPLKFSFWMLRHNTKNCRNVTSYNLAVGDRDRSVLLNLPGREQADFPYVASVKKLADYDYDRHQNAMMVRLDSFPFPLKPTALVIDCEGFEAEVLQGAKGLIPSLKTILVETHRLADGSETFNLVESRIEQFSSDRLDLNTSFIDAENRRWILATSDEQSRVVLLGPRFE
jgi:FkbM family methyltransferase